MRLRDYDKAQKLEDEVIASQGHLEGDQIRVIHKSGTKYKRSVVWLEPTPQDPTNGVVECILALDTKSASGLSPISLVVKHCNSRMPHYGMSVFYLKQVDEPDGGWVNHFEGLIDQAKVGGFRQYGIPADLSTECSNRWENDTWATFMSAYELKKAQVKS